MNSDRVSIRIKNRSHMATRELYRFDGAVEKVEGEPAPQAIVIAEFPTMARAREWYRSPEYAEALAIRPKALTRRLLFVEGIQM